VDECYEDSWYTNKLLKSCIIDKNNESRWGMLVVRTEDAAVVVGQEGSQNYPPTRYHILHSGDKVDPFLQEVSEDRGNFQKTQRRNSQKLEHQALT